MNPKERKEKTLKLYRTNLLKQRQEFFQQGDLLQYQFISCELKGIALARQYLEAKQ